MNKQTIYGVIATLFIVSGATGLVYQIAWFKYLSLFLGNTTYAQTVIIGILAVYCSNCDIVEIL